MDAKAKKYQEKMKSDVAKLPPTQQKAYRKHYESQKGTPQSVQDLREYHTRSMDYAKKTK